jgi:ABC-type branched-subunit amino acid transport system ATPase component
MPERAATMPTDKQDQADAAGRTADPALLVEHLTVFRGPLPAVRDVTLAVPTSGSLGILGRNGAGKSTLIGGLVGVLPARGTIQLHGQDISAVPAWKRARSGLALVPQGRGLLPNMTVEENLQLATLERAGEGPAFDIHELFPALKKLMSRKAGLCSGGEQQQVAVARALLRRPVLLLLDEPTEGLAPIVIAEITQVLRHLSQQGLTLVLAEQHHHIVSALCEEFLVLRSGEAAGYDRTSEEAIQRHYSAL